MLPVASPPPSRPQGGQAERSLWVLTVTWVSARVVRAMPSPPRCGPAPPESGMSSKRSTRIGNFASACSFGPLWVSPSLRQTVADTPSSVFFAPQPPPSGPKVPMKNSDVFGLKPWKLGATRSA